MEQEQYACVNCTATKHSQKDLEAHNRKKHSKNANICTDCGNSFYMPSGLTIHQDMPCRWSRKGRGIARGIANAAAAAAAATAAPAAAAATAAPAGEALGGEAPALEE